MKRFLSKEEARVAELSRNPFKKHKQVRDYFDGLQAIGIDVKLNPRGLVHHERGHTTIIVNRFAPLLGRKALINMAQTLEVIDKPEGELNGEDI
jgi:hypothetical protein